MGWGICDETISSYSTPGPIHGELAPFDPDFMI